MKQRIDYFRPVYPTPAGLITCVAEGCAPNIITLGEVYMLALSPLTIGISIRPGRWSHELITKSGEYVVNLPTAEMTEVVDYCGMVSGRKVDKFSATGLTSLPAAEVKAPLIAECPLNLECKVIQVMPFGSHDVFAGLVVAQHVDDWALDEAGDLDPVRARALAFVARSYWAVGDKVAPAFQKQKRGGA